MAYYDFFSQKLNPERLRINEPMKNHTSFKTGGPADLLILPENEDELAETARNCREQGFPHMIIGNGTNLLFPDEGFRGVVVKTTRSLSALENDGETITAGAGVQLSAISAAALKNGLAGLEFASGIPGTLGGAVFMNAGAYDGEIKNSFLWADVLAQDGVKRVATKDMAFGYRHSAVDENGWIVLRAALRLTEGDRAEIAAKTADYNNRRKEKQPLEFPSAGSVFKRPEGMFAGKLIMDSGLAGYSVGGARVSEKHCGFIINTGGASSRDVLDVIEHTQAVVFEKTGVRLETEIRIIRNQ